MADNIEEEVLEFVTDTVAEYTNHGRSGDESRLFSIMVCHGVKYPPERLSPGTLYFKVTCPRDTLLRSKLSPGQFTLE